MKHRRRLATIFLAIVLAVAAVPTLDGRAQGVPADPGLPGPYATEQFNFTLQGLGATVFYPGAGGAVAAGGPFSGLVLGHGFARARAQHVNNGAFLASHGYIVVTVDFPSPFSPDFDAWAAQISAALDWLEAQNADSASRFYQQIAVDRLGALGHSAGGMATWVAAGQDNRIKATMPLDPVPANDADLPALGAGLVAPSGWTGAPGSSCNASASYNQLYPLVAASHKAQYIVSNATHCDFEDPSNFLCTLTCGGTSDARRQVWRRYTVAWFGGRPGGGPADRRHGRQYRAARRQRGGRRQRRRGPVELAAIPEDAAGRLQHLPAPTARSGVPAHRQPWHDRRLP